jgi:hypothetical protein
MNLRQSSVLPTAVASKCFKLLTGGAGADVSIRRLDVKLSVSHRNHEHHQVQRPAPIRIRQQLTGL